MMEEALVPFAPAAGTRSLLESGRELAARVGGAALVVAQDALWKLGSLCIGLAVWQLACSTFAPDLPTPLASFRELAELLRNPWSTDINDLGLGVQVVASLQRIALGYTLAAIVAIPAGVLIAVNPICRRLFDPIVQMLRPVSPLVWFPLALVTFKAFGGVGSATLFTIFITSLWPTLINTAFGVASLPEDFRTVAKVFQFSPYRYLTKILLPFALPHIVTGLRLSMGGAWLVIVAAEMLSGDTGIGFFAWDAYNAGSYERMIAAVIMIGLVGLALDALFSALHRKLDYAGGAR